MAMRWMSSFFGDGMCCNLDPYQNDPNNPDRNQGQNNNSESIFYRNPVTGQYDQITGAPALARYLSSLSDPGGNSAAPAGFGVGPVNAPPPATLTAASATSSWLTPAIGVAGNIVSAYLQSSANKDAAAIQERLAQQALAYEKEKDAYDRALAVSRYGDYTGRIAPYLSNGVSSGARMASLLGLPAPAPMTTGPTPPPLVAP